MYRLLEILGEKQFGISFWIEGQNIFCCQFKNSNANHDWAHLFESMVKSHDHRSDKQQMTLGIAEFTIYYCPDWHNGDGLQSNSF